MISLVLHVCCSHFSINIFREDDAADRLPELVDEVWKQAEEDLKVDGWLPLDVLVSVKQETLFKAVRQRGSVSDLYKSLEGIIRRADPLGIAEANAMRRLTDLVSSHLSVHEKTVA